MSEKQKRRNKGCPTAQMPRWASGQLGREISKVFDYCFDEVRRIDMQVVGQRVRSSLILNNYKWN